MARWPWQKLTAHQMNIARSSPELRPEILDQLSDTSLLDRAAEELSPDDWNELEGAVDCAISNSGLAKECLTGNGDYGTFPINIEGIPGLYRVTAPDFDPSCYLDTVEEAKNAAFLNYFPFLEDSNPNTA